MNQEIQTLTRLKSINIFLGDKKFTDAFQIIDQLTDDELFAIFDQATKDLLKEGRI